MARVTVEDCVKNIPNRFELVSLAAQRAKQIFAGDPITVERDNDKDAVVALREIAEKTIDFDLLREQIIESYSRFQRPDVIDDGSDTSRVVGASHNVTEGGHIPTHEEVEENYAEETAASAQDIAQDAAGMSFADDEIDADD